MTNLLMCEITSEEYVMCIPVIHLNGKYGTFNYHSETVEFNEPKDLNDNGHYRILPFDMEEIEKSKDIFKLEITDTDAQLIIRGIDAILLEYTKLSIFDDLDL